MSQQVATQTLTIIIHGALVITTTSLPDGTVGQPYNAQIQAHGGVPPYKFTGTGLAPGLAVSPTGIIAGTPTAEGTSDVVISVADSGV